MYTCNIRVSSFLYILSPFCIIKWVGLFFLLGRHLPNVLFLKGGGGDPFWESLFLGQTPLEIYSAV